MDLGFHCTLFVADCTALLLDLLIPFLHNMDGAAMSSIRRGLLLATKLLFTVSVLALLSGDRIQY